MELPLGNLPKGHCRWLRLSVCLSVRPSVRRTKLVHAITRQWFDRESPFSHRMCILGPLRTLLEMGSIDLDLQGHFGLKLIDFRKFDCVHAMTRQGFDRESPFSMCILGPFRTLSKMGSIDLTSKVIFVKCLHCHISGTGWSIDIRWKPIGSTSNRDEPEW